MNTNNIITISEYYSKKYHVPITLILAIADYESRFKTKPGAGGERGIMQIMPATAQGLGYKGTTDDLSKHENSIKYGTLFLSVLLKKYKNNIMDTISAYNLGETKFKRPYNNPVYVIDVYTLYLKYNLQRIGKIIFPLAIAGLVLYISNKGT